MLCDHFITVEEAISDLLPLTAPYIPYKARYIGYKQTDIKKIYATPPQSKYQEMMRKRIMSSNEPDGVLNHICRSHNPVDMICFAMLGQGQKYINTMAKKN